MSANFTGYNGSTYDWDGFDPASLTRFDELWLAFSERKRAVGDELPENPFEQPVSTNKAASIYGIGEGGRALQQMQQFVVASINSTILTGGMWVDYTQARNSTQGNPPFSYMDARDQYVFTQATFYAAAGMDAGGFRRYNGDDWDGTTDPTFEYGYIEAGDIYGWWIWEDLQRAFSTMRMTADYARQVKPDAPNTAFVESDFDLETWTEAKTQASSRYPGTAGEVYRDSLCYKEGRAISDNKYHAEIYCRGVKIEHFYFGSSRGSATKLTPASGYVSFYTQSDIPSMTGTWTFDPQGTDLIKDLYIPIETSPFRAEDRIDSTVANGLAYADGEPPTWPNKPTVGDGNINKGYQVTGNASIITWDFTYSNSD